MGYWIFMLVINLLIPAIMIILGTIYAKRAPKQINYISGYRTAMSMKNQDTWEFAHHHFGKTWRILGWIIVFPSFIVMLLLYGKNEHTIGNYSIILIIIQTILLILSIIPTEVALKKTFDENGNRKQ